jgi:hypothetical protein
LDTSEDIMLSLVSAGRREQVKTLITRIIEYVRKRYPLWDCEALGPWLCWHWCHGLVAALTEAQSDELVAVVVVRFMEEVDGYQSTYHHKPGAGICHVELALAESTAAFCAACRMLELRHGSPEQIVFQRGSRGQKTHIHPFAKMMERLEHAQS